MNSMFADAAAGAPGHRDAVAGGGVGVGGVAVDLAGAAGGQHHRARGSVSTLPLVDVERVDAVAARLLVALQVARGDQVDRHPALAQRDVGVAAAPLSAARRGWPCRWHRRMRDAPHAWPPSRVRCRPSGPGVVGERHALRHQPFDRGRAVLGDEARGVLVDQAGAGLCVSCTWDSMLSSVPSTPTMPPCAQAVAPS
jgi:hypothetical protein